MHTPSSIPPSSEPPPSRPRPRSLIAYCLERDTLLFSLKMALPIGTLLAAINHGQALLSGHFTAGELLPLCLTYCVPFAVAMYSQAQGKRQRDRDHLSVWLHHVATNLCIDLLHRRRRLSWWPLARGSRSAADGVSEDELFSPVPSGSGGIPEVAEREQIQRVFACMPQDYAIVLMLSVILGFPYQEIAAITGLSPTAAAMRLSRAKRMFVERYQRLCTGDIGRQEERP